MHARQVIGIRWMVSLIAALGFTQPVLCGRTAVEDANSSSSSSLAVSREYRYRVDARVRLLLAWMRRSDIGDGRITWRTAQDGTRGYELLVGTDPARTPRRINRWGYLREESGPNGATVFGVMSHSDEQSVQDADKNTRATGGGVHVFKALRQHLVGSHAEVTKDNVRVSSDLTYSDLGTLLAAVTQAPSTTRTTPLGGWTAPGFLAAAAALLEQGRTTTGNKSGFTPLVRVYPYNGRLYELQLQSAERVDRVVRGEQSFGPAIRGRFNVVNRTTNKHTPFTIVYGVEGSLADVPLLISFRPRWWLEVECVLDQRTP